MFKALLIVSVVLIFCLSIFALNRPIYFGINQYNVASATGPAKIMMISKFSGRIECGDSIYDTRKSASQMGWTLISSECKQGNESLDLQIGVSYLAWFEKMFAKIPTSSPYIYFKKNLKPTVLYPITMDKDQENHLVDVISTQMELNQKIPCEIIRPTRASLS